MMKRFIEWRKARRLAADQRRMEATEAEAIREAFWMGVEARATPEEKIKAWEQVLLASRNMNRGR